MSVIPALLNLKLHHLNMVQECDEAIRILNASKSAFPVSHETPPAAAAPDEAHKWADVSIDWSDSTRTDIRLPTGEQHTLMPGTVESIRDGFSYRHGQFEIALHKGKLVCRDITV